MSDAFINLAISPNWEEMPSGNVQALMRRNRTNNNVLQISFTRSLTGRPLSPPPDPVEMAAALVRQQGGRADQGFEGQCAVGKFGRVIYSADKLAYGEAWIVTDGSHLFLATFSCNASPSAEELREVAEMVTSVTWPKG